MYLYISSRSETEKHLVESECMAITGVTPDDRGIVLSESEADVSRAAYIKYCVKLEIHAPNLSELYKSLEEAKLETDQFRVSVLRIPGSLPIDSNRVMHEAGARIGGKPNLSEPKTVFLVIATHDELWLGEVLSTADQAWEAHSKKMYQYSSALPSRLARAMVNLVAAPGDRIIDPCCGSGTILIEASSIGIKAVGCDINPRMAKASYKNLEYFNLSGMVLLADARNIGGRFDAVVTDLPYGRNCPTDEDLCYEILQNIKFLAPRAAIVTSENIDTMLSEMGYNVNSVIPVPKSSLTRYIHVM